MSIYPHTAGLVIREVFVGVDARILNILFLNQPTFDRHPAGQQFFCPGVNGDLKVSFLLDVPWWFHLSTW